MRFLVDSICDKKDSKNCTTIEGTHGGIKNFISNNLLLYNLEKKIRKYPEVARKILKSDLIDMQIQEMN